MMVRFGFILACTVGTLVVPTVFAISRSDTSRSGTSALRTPARQQERKVSDTAGQVSGTVLLGEYRGVHGVRPWRLYVPGSHGITPATTLIVMLHGCLQDAADIARGSRFDAVAEREGVMVLYPEQTVAANPRRCWNWFDAAHQGRENGEPALLASMIQEVVTAQRIDPSRVHLAGVSAGAAMGTLLAVAYPERFASLTSMAGVAWKAAPDVSSALQVMQRGAGDALPDAAAMIAFMGARARAIPLFVVHGVADAVVAVRNSDELSSQFVALHDALRARTGAPALARTTVEPRAEDGVTIAETRWQHAPGAADIVFWRVAELGHAWLGGSSEGTFTEPKGPDLSSAIVAFAKGRERR